MLAFSPRDTPWARSFQLSGGSSTRTFPPGAISRSLPNHYSALILSVTVSLAVSAAVCCYACAVCVRTFQFADVRVFHDLSQFSMLAVHPADYCVSGYALLYLTFSCSFLAVHFIGDSPGFNIII